MKGNAEYERRRNKIFDGKTEEIQLKIPSDCKPRFDPSTPEKDLVISRAQFYFDVDWTVPHRVT
jgi:hypothetical protein